ncbi:Protein NDR1 [Forsythia ovata]|uniref:Protein NDR1 n=1 Tax=Forsythia ovata TaxID=205694 RepID=A0ABD1P224_9LAMI
MGGETTLCLCCSIPCLLTLFIWMGLSLQNYKPNCYIEDFYVPALNKHINSTATTAANFIFFDLKLQNVMEENGVLYDTINLTFSYGLNPSVPIGKYTLPGAYQGHKKTAHRRDIMPTHGVNWDDAFAAVLNGSKVVFRVDLAGKVKFKRFFSYSRTKALVVGADVEVDGSGNKVRRKAIKMKSGGRGKPKLQLEAGGSLISSF